MVFRRKKIQKWLEVWEYNNLYNIIFAVYFSFHCIIYYILNLIYVSFLSAWLYVYNLLYKYCFSKYLRWLFF